MYKLIYRLLGITNDRYVLITLILSILTMSTVYYCTEYEKYKIERINFMFTPTHEVSKSLLRDLIDSEEKRLAVENDPTIEQIVNKPVIGAMVDGSSKKIVKKSKADTLIKHELKNVPEWNYEKDGYKFFANVLAVFPSYLEAMLIENLNQVAQINAYHATTPISHPTEIKTGNLLVKNMDGSFYATKKVGFDMVATAEGYTDNKFDLEKYLADNGVELADSILIAKK